MSLALCIGLAGVASCGGTTPSAPSQQVATLVLPATFWRGGDVSSLTRIEQGGAAFRDGGGAGDALAILARSGANAFRLRLFVDPNHQDVVVNDLPYTIALAKRVKAVGGKLLLDLHYSDTWADPGAQATPAAWQSLGIDALEQQVEDYTASVVSQLKAAGALPDIVQIGNEIDDGLLWPLGKIAATGADSAASRARFGRLLSAGVRGVRRPLAAGDAVRLMLHYSQGGNASGAQWFFDLVAQQGVAYDLIGVSYYPWWHGSVADLQGTLSALAQRYGKDVMVVETEYPWRAGFAPSGGSVAAMTWPATPAGQTQFLRDVLAAVIATPGGHGAGVLWWYPEAVRVPSLAVWGDGAVALFDDAGTVLPAAALSRGTEASKP